MAAQATEYQEKLKQEEKEKEEKTHFDGLDEEAMVQISQTHAGKHMLKLEPLNLAQTKSKIVEDQIENNELLQTLSKAGLTDDQIQYLSQMTDSSEAPDINLLNQLNSLAGETTEAGAQAKTATSASAGADQATNQDEMKQYAENIAIAADEINNENTIPTADEAVQLKSSTKDKLSITEEVQLDTKQKEELTQGANQAVGVEADPLKTTAETNQLASSSKEQAIKDQFEHDKKQALDEGYSEDQAIQYATQE